MSIEREINRAARAKKLADIVEKSEGEGKKGEKSWRQTLYSVANYIEHTEHSGTDYTALKLMEGLTCGMHRLVVFHSHKGGLVGQ